MNDLPRRHFLKLAGLGIGSMVMESAKANDLPMSKVENPKPHIIYIMTDQLRADVPGYAGGPVPTPALDALAREAVDFCNAYTPSPVCGPARAAVFSGLYPPGNGVTSNWRAFREGVRLFPEDLRGAGYHTANIGKLHFVPHGNSWGFDINLLNDGPIGIYSDDQDHSHYARYLRETYGEEEGRRLLAMFDEDESQWPDGDLRQFILGRDFIPEEHHMTPWTAREACRYLDTCDASTPQFLHLSFFGPHHPWRPPGKWAEMFDPDQVELPAQFHALMDSHPVFAATKAGLRNRLGSQLDERGYREIIALYHGQVAMLDHYIGTVIAKLKEKGMWENSLVVFSSDHGEHLGQYGLFFKGDMYDSSAKVPLLIKPPRTRAEGATCDKVVSTLDLCGTFLDTAGVGDWRRGRECGSLAKEIAGPTLEGDHGSARAIIGQKDRNTAMLREGRFKLIRLATGPEAPAAYEFYDMEESPVETVNRFNDPEFAAERDRMVAVLEKWWTPQNAACEPKTPDFRKKAGG